MPVVVSCDEVREYQSMGRKRQRDAEPNRVLSAVWMWGIVSGLFLPEVAIPVLLHQWSMVTGLVVWALCVAGYAGYEALMLGRFWCARWIAARRSYRPKER